MAASLSELPSNILSDILSRLSIKTLFVCRCVCKAFLDITTSNPHFNSLHAPYTTQCLAIQFEYYSMTSIHLVDSELDTSFSVGENVELETMFQIPRFPTRHFKNYGPFVGDENRFILMNSCNGLLFFAENSLRQRLFVCNPITREYVTMLELDKYNRHRSTMGYWFGFSPEENLYKVLRIFGTANVNGSMPWAIGFSNDEKWAQVYTVGSSSWRLLEEKPHSDYDISLKSSSAILNGTVCWLSGIFDYNEMLRFIVYFDFHTEKFGEFPAPVGFRNNYKPHSRSIGVLGGCLCVTDDSRYFDIWVMKEFGCRESWTKLFSIDMESIMGMYIQNPLRLLQILGDGKILMIRDYNVLVKFDPETKDFRFLEINSRCTPDKVVVYTPTFVPLKDILMVDNLTVRNLIRSVVQEDRMQEDHRFVFPTFGSVKQEDGIRIKDSDYFGSCPWSTPIFI
ncbi:hypothetical protein CASFOL_010577 [Castilleja foliolosa]|uniref:F-box domain-containing protein n=1 Tax=Castilleja foliolosa TaxID=1961234 RepID=A0ABD3DUX9_9LAMI